MYLVVLPTVGGAIYETYPVKSLHFLIRKRVFFLKFLKQGKGLTSWLSFVVSSVCHFPIGILGQVWYLIVSIPDLCNLTYFPSRFPWGMTRVMFIK